MPKSWMHWLAWTVGAFTLVILGAVVGHAARLEFAAAEPVAKATATPLPGAPLEALLQEREQAYQQLIAEANARLEQAYQQIEELSAQLATSSSSTANAPPSAPSVALSPARAIWIAMNAAPGSALIKEPELVLFQGVLAYEVVLDQGTLYIDANTGQILYNGIPPVIQVVQSQPSSGKAGGKNGSEKKHEEKERKGEHEKEEKKKGEHEEEHRDDDD